MKKLIIALSLFTFQSVMAQNNVGIGTNSPNSQSILDITSTDKGILISRLTTNARTTLGTVLTVTEDGMLVYDKDLTNFFYWDGPNLQWVQVGSGNGDNWGTAVVNTSGSNISGNGTASNPITIIEVDGSITNEIQTVSKSGNIVTLSNSGGSFTDDDTQLTESQVDAFVNNNGYLTSFTEVDGSTTNEIELPVGGNNGQVLSTNGSGTYSWINQSIGTDDQNISGSGFNASTGNLTIGIENGNNQNVNLNGLKDHDWYEVGGTSQPNSINDNIFTQGNVSIGLTNPTYDLDIFDNRTTTLRVASGTLPSSGGRIRYENGPAIIIESPNVSYGERMASGLFFNRLRENVEWYIGTESGGFGSPPPYPAVSQDKFFISRNLKTTNANERTRPIQGNNAFLVIDKAGKIGLGMTNPSYKLTLPNNTSNAIGRGLANAWNTYSDGRLKTDRKELTYGLDEIMQITPLSYQHHNSTFHAETEDNEFPYIEIKESESTKQIGFIAQDLYKIIPEIVSPPENEESELWSVDYTKLTPVLVKAIQEQQNQINELKKALEQLSE